jgi:hypothetical protein
VNEQAQPNRSNFNFAATAIILSFSLAASGAFAAAGDCVFPKRPPVTLKNMGPCEFDLDSLSFKGTPAEQAACLTTPVLKGGYLAAERAELPQDFATRVGHSVDLPKREELLTFLQFAGLGKELGESLSTPVSHANDGDPLVRSATYFVIHDTSAPNFASRPFPADIDTDWKINNLERYKCANHIEQAHTFTNRMGAVYVGHDFEVPWRATKFETATNFKQALKGLFVHNELIQPRRSEPRRGWQNDFQAPLPGFTQAQYDRLALIYVVASLRAGFWMIPAFHAVIDEGIYNKHDDPQNFELARFAAAIDELTNTLPITAASIPNFIP